MFRLIGSVLLHILTLVYIYTQQECWVSIYIRVINCFNIFKMIIYLKVWLSENDKNIHLKIAI